jgi:hypothetical protein
VTVNTKSTNVVVTVFRTGGEAVSRGAVQDARNLFGGVRAFEIWKMLEAGAKGASSADREGVLASRPMGGTLRDLWVLGF